MSRSLKVLLVNLLLIVATPVQTLHAPTAMPAGDRYIPFNDPHYPAHSDRGNFAEDVDWSDRAPQRDFLDLTPDTDQPVPDDEPLPAPFNEPADVHPFHEEELDNRRIQEAARSPATEALLSTVMGEGARQIQQDIDSDFLQRVNELTRNLPPGAAGFHGMPELAVGPSEALGPPVDRRPSITSYRGRWGAAETYNRGDLVVLNDNTAWVACEQNFGIEPNSWRDMHTWDFISQEGPARTGQWRLDRVMEQIEAQQRVGEPSLFEQPKCPWCQIRGCDNPRHPENLKAIHQIAEQGGF